MHPAPVANWLPRGFHGHTCETACTFSRSCGDASGVTLHLGYLAQPRKYLPPRPGRSFMGPLQSGQVSVTSTAGPCFLGRGGGRESLNFSASSGVMRLVLRHLGYPLQPRNGPRGPRLMTIWLPHFSQAIPVSTGRIGFPSASASMANLHLG